MELSEVTRQQLITHIARLKEVVPDARASWSRAGNIHLTLKFLGNISQTSTTNLSNAAAQAVAGMAPFPIRLEQTGVFPARGSARVLWIGVNDLEGKLGELHAQLEEESARVGFDRESRIFHPHLTLARIRNPQHAAPLAAAHNAMKFEPVEIVVSALSVIRSELSSAGSKYTTISQHRLELE